MERRQTLTPDDAFDLGEAFSGDALRVDSRRLLKDAKALARGDRTPREPVAFVRAEGRRPLDLVGTTYAVLLLVSPRVVELLDAGRFTGWTTFP